MAILDSGGPIVQGPKQSAVNQSLEAQLAAIREAELRARQGASDAQGTLENLVQRGILSYNQAVGLAQQALNYNTDFAAQGVERSLPTMLNTINQGSNLSNFIGNDAGQRAIEQLRIGTESGKRELTSGVRDAINTLSQQFSTARNNFIPFQSSGLKALDEMTSLLGLPGKPSALYSLGELDTNKPKQPSFNLTKPGAPTYPSAPNPPGLLNQPLVKPAEFTKSYVKPPKAPFDQEGYWGLAAGNNIKTFEAVPGARIKDRTLSNNKQIQQYYTDERGWEGRFPSGLDAANYYESVGTPVNKDVLYNAPSFNYTPTELSFGPPPQFNEHRVFVPGPGYQPGVPENVAIELGLGSYRVQRTPNPDYVNYVNNYNQQKAAVNQSLYTQQKSQFDAEQKQKLSQYDNELAMYNENLARQQQAEAQYQHDLELYNKQASRQVDLEAQQKANYETAYQNYLAQKEGITNQYNTELNQYNQAKSQYDQEQSDYANRLAEYNTKRSQLESEAATSALSPTGILEQLAATPGYRFQLEEGLKAIENRASSKGLLNSGAVLKDMVQFSQGLANQTYGQRLSNLAALVGQGFEASKIKSDLETRYGTSVADIQTSLGLNRAQFDLDRAAKESALNSSIAGLLAPIQSSNAVAKADIYHQRNQLLSGLYSTLGQNISSLYSTQGANTLQAYQMMGDRSSQIQQTLADALANIELSKGSARSSAYLAPLSSQQFERVSDLLPKTKQSSRLLSGGLLGAMKGIATMGAAGPAGMLGGAVAGGLGGAAGSYLGGR